MPTETPAVKIKSKMNEGTKGSSRGKVSSGFKLTKNYTAAWRAALITGMRNSSKDAPITS